MNPVPCRILVAINPTASFGRSRNVGPMVVDLLTNAGFVGSTLREPNADVRRYRAARAGTPWRCCGSFSRWHRSATSWRSTVQVRVDAVLVSVANNVSLGGGMRIVPHARVDDGVFDLFTVGRLRLLRSFPKVFSGAHTGLDGGWFGTLPDHNRSARHRRVR